MWIPLKHRKKWNLRAECKERKCELSDLCLHIYLALQQEGQGRGTGIASAGRSPSLAPLLVPCRVSLGTFGAQISHVSNASETTWGTQLLWG